jgi:hypothetical protein
VEPPGKSGRFSTAGASFEATGELNTWPLPLTGDLA